MWRRLVFSRLLVINVAAARADPGQTKTIHCAAMASRATRTNTAAADSSSKDDRPTPSWDTSPRQRVPFLRDMERLDYLFSLVTGLRSVFTTGTASRRGRTVCESEAQCPHPSHRQQPRHPLHLGPTVTNRWLSTRYASASSSFERTCSRSRFGARFRGTRLFWASVCYLW